MSVASTSSRGSPTLETMSPTVPCPPRDRRALRISGWVSAARTLLTLASLEDSWERRNRLARPSLRLSYNISYDVGSLPQIEGGVRGSGAFCTRQGELGPRSCSETDQHGSRSSVWVQGHHIETIVLVVGNVGTFTSEESNKLGCCVGVSAH